MVAASYIHPILAVFVGALIGVPTGGLVWVLVRIWPVLRLLWWWTPEIGLTTLLGSGWVQLANHTPTLVTLLVVALVVGVPAAIPASRRQVIAWTWCLVVRHRLRVCFAQFIIANQSGSLPLILWARPTPVGERVWVYLRPGLSMADLEGRLDRIAVACHAATALIERASDGKRRLPAVRHQTPRSPHRPGELSAGRRHPPGHPHRRPAHAGHPHGAGPARRRRTHHHPAGPDQEAGHHRQRQQARGFLGT